MKLSPVIRRLFGRTRPNADGIDWKRASTWVRTMRPERIGPSADDTTLDLNNPFPVAAAVGVRATADRPSPPGGLPALREAVAELTAGDAEGVLVTAGATGAFATVLTAFVDPGRPVVLLAPCSPLFARLAQAHRARVRWVPTHVEGGGLRLDFDALSRAMRGAALLAVADPGNPLGAPLYDADTDRLRWTADRSDVLLYVDETFARFRGVGCRLAGLAPERTLVAGSLAATGHGALRVGWLAGPPPLVRACERAQSLAGPPPAICQHLAWRVLLSGPGDLDTIPNARRDAAARLQAMGLAVDDPAAGCFLWVNVGRDGRAFADELLAAEGVRVGPGDRYGPGGERFVRLSAATEPGRLREGLTRLARFVGAEPRPAPAPIPAPARAPAFSR